MNPNTNVQNILKTVDVSMKIIIRFYQPRNFENACRDQASIILVGKSSNKISDLDSFISI